MIIYVKSSELDDVIEKLENIEEKFWLNYKYYRDIDRKETAKQFESLFKLLWDLKKDDGIQETMNYEG